MVCGRVCVVEAQVCAGFGEAPAVEVRSCSQGPHLSQPHHSCHSGGSGWALLHILSNPPWSRGQVLLCHTLGVGQGDAVVLKLGCQSWWRLGLLQDCGSSVFCVSHVPLLLGQTATIACSLPRMGTAAPGMDSILLESWLISQKTLLSQQTDWSQCSVPAQRTAGCRAAFAAAGAGQPFVPSAVVGAEHSNAGTDGHLGLATVALAERSEGRAFFFLFLKSLLWTTHLEMLET